MKITYKYIITLFCFVAVIFPSCRDHQWDTHGELSVQELGISLLDALQANPAASKFYQAAMKAGYEEVLAQGGNLTVFVPENDAWQNIDMNDVEICKAIVAYHIAIGKYLTTDTELYNSVQMLNTKMVRYDSPTQTFNSSKIVSGNYVAGNGVFHRIDRLMELKVNIWEHISGMPDLEQVAYIQSINHKEVDMLRSVQTGVNATGRPVYDTVWMNINNFLKTVPLDNESEELTYLVVKNEGFDMLYQKYNPYFKCPTEQATDSLTRFNVCQDFVFNGIVDITRFDTLTNIFGVKVPVKDVVIESTFDASNGRVYFIDKSNILLREKFKPVLIEGEDFNRAASTGVLYVRYKLWASGTKDLLLSCTNNQTDTLPMLTVAGTDSIVSRSFTAGDANNRANTVNFWIEYKAPVYSADYEIHYVSYNDIEDHFSRPYQTLRFDQKLFVSMPGQPELRKSGNQVVNNYLGDARCFVSQDTAGIHKERIMKQWNLTADVNQYIQTPVNTPEATLMKVPQTGVVTMWLCNTARSNATSAQGMLLLDYIKLVPKLPEE